MSFPALRQHIGHVVPPLRAAGVLALVVCGESARATETAAVSFDVGGRPTITNPVAIWELPPEQKTLRHPIRIEGRVNFVDRLWRNSWIEHEGVGTYLMLAPEAPPLREGQRVLIEGSIIPDRGLAADSTRVTVLKEFEPVTPLDANGRIRDLRALSSRIVTVDAYVSSQLYVDGEHVRLGLIVDDRPVIGWIRPTNERAIPKWEGKYIRVEALYSSRFKPTNTETSIELWCGPERNVQVIGTLEKMPVFERPPTAISELPFMPLGSEVLIRGTAEAHEAGVSIVVRDKTGQIVVRSTQPEQMPFGAEVEAIGRLDAEGAKWVLRQGLYRRIDADAERAPTPATGPLDHVDAIRQLSMEQAAAGRPVRIAGMVTWSLPGSDFFFLQDVTGGIRVQFDPQKLQTPPLEKYLEVEGITIDGGFMPAVQLRATIDRGAMSHPEGRLVSFEQASSGKEDGQWVAMRGFIQRTESDGDWRWIYVTTPGGEVVGHLQSPVNFVANPGSLIRVLGVCEATADKAGVLTGVMLRVPFIHSITVEDDAPVDYFDLPVHSLKSLRRLSGARDLTRVRVSAEVLHSVPGRSVYVQEGETGLQLLSRQDQPLTPGDRIDAVGILGWEGARVVLREAVFRKLGRGEAPAPVELTNPEKLVPALDARLVQVDGLLIDVSQRADHTRLTLQSGETLFEATLNRAAAESAAHLAVGAKLRLRGIYQLGFDDARQFRSFALQLRSAADITVLQKPRLWTVQRALTAVAVLGGFTLIGLAWITALRRRVHQQTRQIREQLERQTRLEAEVQRAARLESLGVLAGGMAHDFNNLLTIIIGNLGLALGDDKLSDATTRCLREIERGATRARALTQQLLTFAKGGDPLRLPVRAAEIVRSAADRSLHGSSVRSEYVVPDGLWNVLADRDQMAQAIQNLVLNAVQAMPQGGTLTISFSNETVAAGTHKHLESGRYVKIALKDVGEGMSPEILPRIFDPYFSTRRTGSGLGLATVYSIVKRHAGWIDVDSRPGQGSTFNVWLPATDVSLLEAPDESAVPLAPAPIAMSASTATRGTRVLLMDDEASIRSVATQVLERMGLDVTAVPDGAEALTQFSVAQHSGRPFQLLLLDLTVPGGMGGREVLELIRKLDPKVPAIVSSGYSNDPVMANHRDYGFIAVVQKPYEPGRLAAAVSDVLRQEAQTAG